MPESADATMPAYLTEGQKKMLISNGTYKEDGTVNLETAKAPGLGEGLEGSSRDANQEHDSE